MHAATEGGPAAAAALAARFPALWHCCFVGAWPGICALGLHSVASLTELAAAPAPLRKRVTQELRIHSERLELPGGHHAVLRDQRPLGSRRLERHLKDIGEAEWLALLNARVFLFTREPDARRLLGVYKAAGQDVIKLKTAALLAACQGRVEVTTSNSGALPRTAGPSRGRDTFVPLASFPADKVAAIQEVTVLGAIDDVQPLASSVIRHHPDGTKRRIWP